MSTRAAPESVPAPPARAFTPAPRALVQRDAASSRAIPATAPESVHRTLSSPGRPLDAGTRDYMESRFGHDFSHVRVHTDSRAADSAREINAHAYTVGSDIAFAAGRYQPDTQSGRQLLAHELAHTIQQQGLQRRASDLAVDTAPGSRLEHEADSAARAVAAGFSAPAVAARAPGPVVSRAPNPAAPSPAAALARTWTALAAGSPLAADGVTHLQDGGGGIVAFRIKSFPLPQKKGLPDVIKLWKEKAAAQALEATVGFTGGKPTGAELWQSRDRTSELKSSWIAKMGWTDANAAANWHACGGTLAANKVFYPKIKAAKGAAHMDHVVELQIGGTNTRNNVQVHDGSENTSSGSTIWAYISGLAQRAYNSLPAPRPQYVILHFDDVAWDPAAPSAPAAAPAPGAAASYMEVEYAALQKRGAAQPQLPGTDSAGRATEPYSVEAAGNKDILQVLPKPATPTLLDGDENRAARQLIAGLLLTKLNRPATGSETIDAVVDQKNLMGNSKPTKVPLTLSNTPKSLSFKVDTASRKLALAPGGKPAFDFIYPYLSKGHVDLKYDADKGLGGTGTLTPSLPLLNKLPLKVEMGQGILRTYLDAKDSTALQKLQTSIPHLRFTKAELGVDLLPDFNPVGNLEFKVGPNPEAPYLVGGLKITGNTSGLDIAGKITVQLPRIAPVVGDVWYRNAQWGGEISIKATDIQFPGVTSGALKATFGATGMDLSGSVGMKVAGQDLTLSAQRSDKGNWLFSTDATFKLKHLEPIVAKITTDGKSVWGSGEAGITYKGITGRLKAKYNNVAGGETGGWSGSVEAKFAKGKATGGITVNLSQTGKIYGDGNLTYPFTDKLVGSVDIGLSEAGVIKVKGTLAFADAKIFEGISDKKDFPGLPKVSVPIYGFTLGPLGDIGLVLRIIPSLGVDYSVGPGWLKGIFIKAGFEINPLADDINFAFDAGATVVVTVKGGINFGVEAELALAALVASISAGAGIKARLGLAGELKNSFAFHYEKSFWTASSDTSLLLKPELLLNGYLYVRAEADFKVFKEKAEKKWDLLNLSWGSDMEFGLKKATLGYDSRTGFVFPTFDKLEWAYPKDFKLEQRIKALFAKPPSSQIG